MCYYVRQARPCFKINNELIFRCYSFATFKKGIQIIRQLKHLMNKQAKRFKTDSTVNNFLF